MLISGNDFFTCANGRRILRIGMCDGNNNCGDFSDEEYCRKCDERVLSMTYNQAKTKLFVIGVRDRFRWGGGGGGVVKYKGGGTYFHRRGWGQSQKVH